MANLNTKKISDFSELNELTGNELLVVSYNKKTYNIPVKYILGTVIKSIIQVESDDKSYSTVNMITDDNKIKSFIIKNGSKGETGNTGYQGDKGLTGDSGKLLDDDENIEVIDNLTSTDTDKGLSANQGKILGDAISNLMEVYLHSESAYQQLYKDNNILDNVKYYIYEEGDVTQYEIDYELQHLYEAVDTQLKGKEFVINSLDFSTISTIDDILLNSQYSDLATDVFPIIYTSGLTSGNTLMQLSVRNSSDLVVVTKDDKVIYTSINDTTMLNNTTLVKIPNNVTLSNEDPIYIYGMTNVKSIKLYNIDSLASNPDSFWEINNPINKINSIYINTVDNKDLDTVSNNVINTLITKCNTLYLNNVTKK